MKHTLLNNSNKIYLLGFAIISLISGFFYAFPIKLTQAIIDELGGNKNLKMLITYVLLYMIIRSLGCLSDFLSALLSKRITTNLMINLHKTFLEKMFSIFPDIIYTMQFEKLFTIYTNDISTLANGFSGPILWFCSSLSLFLWSSATLVSIRFELALIYVVAALIIMANTLKSGNQIKENNLQSKAVEEEKISLLRMIFEQYMKIHILNQSGNMIDLNTNNDIKAMKLGYRETKISGLKTLINDNVYYLAGALVWLLGGIFIINGSMSVGEIVAFIAFAGMIVSPIIRFSSQWTALQKIGVSRGRIDAFLTQPEIEWGDIDIDKTWFGNLTFDHVNFEYSEDKKIFNNLNLVFEPGSCYCLKGSNGCGKSTLFKLLCRIHDNYSGKICYNGISVRDMSKESLYNILSYENEEPIIVRDTLKYNLTFGLSNYDADEMMRLYHETGLADMLGESLDMMIENGEKQISRGQMQLIGIIRALLSKKRILIFDETLSGISHVLIENLMNIFKQYCIENNSIIIYVTHDVKYQDMANRYYNLNNE